MIGAEQLEPWGLGDRRLWSLWQIMRQVRIASLLTISNVGGAAAIMDAVWEFPIKARKLDDAAKQKGIDFYRLAETECVELELVSSLATVRRILNELSSNKEVTRKEIAPLELELEGRLFDELQNRTFWALSMRESELYRNPRIGWEEIITRFPDTITDIEEASRCFAMSRYAAAVFHSLQIVEVGLIELGNILVITDPLPGWTATTSRLKAVLNVRYPDRTPFQRTHSAILEQIQATTLALQGAWRNKISHAYGRLTLMTSDFAPDVAEEILMASRGFMRRLATEMPTSPDPDA